MKRLFVLALAASLSTGVVLAGPAHAAIGTTSAAATPAAPAASSIEWGPCSDPDLVKAHAQCGDLQVPLDYTHPDGQQISLAVSRVLHTSSAADYQGVMLVNPGGPGGSGLGLSILGQFVPKHAGDAYDWIGFDPRGVGSSKPSLSCLPHYFGYNRPYYVPETAELERTWLARSDAYAKACGANARALLPHMKTTDAAKDMDSIRTALGARQINYYGFSYGTYLGQVYSTMFPSRVRRMVLDSNVDPRRVWYAANLDQDVAFDRNIDIWFGWLAKYDKVYHLGSNGAAVRNLFYAEEQRLRKQPAGGLIGADEWVDTFLQAGYYQVTWLDLADVFSAWINKHDAKALKDAYDSAAGPGDDNGFAVYNAVQCTDVQWPTSWSRWRRDNDRVYRKAPFETWANAWYNAPCLTWPAKAGRPTSVDGRHVAGALLVGETLDAATPFTGSLEVRRRFPSSSLIASPGGTSHAVSLFGNACVDDQIADYLATGKLPPRKPGNGPDATCQPLPQPVPTATAVAATSTKAQLAAGRLQQIRP